MYVCIIIYVLSRTTRLQVGLQIVSSPRSNAPTPPHAQIESHKNWSPSQTCKTSTNKTQNKYVPTQEIQKSTCKNRQKQIQTKQNSPIQTQNIYKQTHSTKASQRLAHCRMAQDDQNEQLAYYNIQLKSSPTNSQAPGCQCWEARKTCYWLNYWHCPWACLLWNQMCLIVALWERGEDVINVARTN